MSTPPERTATPEELAEEMARAESAPVPSWANPPATAERAGSEEGGQQ